MKINRYSSLTGWVRVLSEGLLLSVMMTRVTWMPQSSGNIIRSGQRWASYELSEVNARHIFSFSSCCLNCSDTANGGIYLMSIWTFNKKSKDEKGKGTPSPSDYLWGISSLLSPNFHDEIYSVIIIIRPQTQVVSVCSHLKAEQQSKTADVLLSIWHIWKTSPLKLQDECANSGSC